MFLRSSVLVAPQDVEANTVRLEEHGKTVLVLEKSAGSAEQGGAGNNSKWVTSLFSPGRGQILCPTCNTNTVFSHRNTQTDVNI